MTAKPSLDMRGIRLTERGYALIAERHYDRQLCTQCGAIAFCKTRATLERLRPLGYDTTMVRCTMFRPILAFRRPLTGLEGLFNTFRVAGAWYDRVRVGERVALADAGLDLLIGEAVVKARYKGTFNELAPHHAQHNHFLKGREGIDAPAELLRILRRFYGTTWADPERTFSVIYLERPAHETEAQCHQGSSAV